MFLFIFIFAFIGKHAIFGRVSDGMNVVKRMGLVRTDANDR
jgi:peptidyl-prolyl cis-trans isomerase-like 1